MGDPTFPLNYPLRDERVQRLGRLGRRRKRFRYRDGRPTRQDPDVLHAGMGRPTLPSEVSAGLCLLALFRCPGSRPRRRDGGEVGEDSKDTPVGEAVVQKVQLLEDRSHMTFGGPLRAVEFGSDPGVGVALGRQS